MKNIKLQRDELGEAYSDEGVCDLEPIDRKAFVLEVLEAVDNYLTVLGLEVVVGDDGQDNAVWFKVEKA